MWMRRIEIDDVVAGIREEEPGSKRVPIERPGAGRRSGKAAGVATIARRIIAGNVSAGAPCGAQPSLPGV